MTKAGRTTDPKQSVQRAIDERRGFTSQADVREGQRAAQRLENTGNSLNNLNGPINIKNDVTINEGLLTIEIVNDDVDGLQVGPVIDPAFPSGPALYFMRTSTSSEYEFYITNASAFPMFRVLPNDNLVQLQYGAALEIHDSASNALAGTISSALTNVDVTGTWIFTGAITAASFTTSGVVTSASAKRWESGAHHDPGATTLSVTGMPAWTVGTIVSADDADGSWASYSTTAVNGNAVGPFGPLACRRDWGFDTTAHIKTGSVITNQRVHVGLYASDPSGTSSPTINCCGFRFATDIPDTNWICRFGDGAAGASLDSGIPVVAATDYTLRMVGTSSEVRWYIDDVLVATRSANIPTATALLAPYTRITTLANVIRSVLFGFVNTLSL